MEKKDSTTRMKRRNMAVRVSILEPRPTAPCPSGARHESVKVPGKFCHRGPCRDDGFDALRLAFVNYVHDIFCYMFGYGEDAAMTDWSVGAKEDRNIYMVRELSMGLLHLDGVEGSSRPVGTYQSSLAAQAQHRICML